MTRFEMRHLFTSVTFRIGITIILVQVVVLAIIGSVYVARFRTQVDERIRARVELPGMLVSRGLLSFSSVADEQVMRELVGEELLDGFVVGSDKRVVYSLNPDHARQEITELAGIDPDWFGEELTESLLEETADGLISITPIQAYAREKSSYFVYIKVGTEQAAREKSSIVELFVLGSVFSLVITSLVIMLSFRLAILIGITDVLNVLGRVEAGDLTARTSKAISKDEIGDLQRRVNSMVVALEQRTEEREQAQEALRASEERYRELFDNIDSGVAVYGVVDNGQDFIFQDFNKAAERIDGDKREDLIGKSIFDVRTGVQELGLIEVFRRVLETGRPRHHPITLYQDERLNGWYENFVYRLSSGEIVAVFEDITERKQAEEELKKHREHLEEMVAERTAELQRFVNLMAGREVRMAELKGVIRELRAQLDEAGLTPVADDPLLTVTPKGK